MILDVLVVETNSSLSFTLKMCTL